MEGGWVMRLELREYGEGGCGVVGEWACGRSRGRTSRQGGGSRGRCVEPYAIGGLFMGWMTVRCMWSWRGRLV